MRRAGPRRRQRAVRGDPREPLRRDVHRRTSTRTTSQLITHADHKIALEMPEMLDEIRGLSDAPAGLTTPEFPIVLSAGERRAYTANDIFRDPTWRKRDADGALRVSVEDAAGARPGRRRPRADHHRGRQRRGERRDQRGDAARARVAAQRLRPRLHRRRRPRDSPRRRARTRSRPPTGATPTPARRGTSTCLRGSRPYRWRWARSEIRESARRCRACSLRCRGTRQPSRRSLCSDNCPPLRRCYRPSSAPADRPPRKSRRA